MTRPRVTYLRAALKELRVALDNDSPVALTDDELAEFSELCADELVRRLLRYALEQGDLDADSEPLIDAREDMLIAIRLYRKEKS